MAGKKHTGSRVQHEKEELRLKAMALYVKQGHSISEIRNLLHVARLTIRKWIRKENWDGMRVALNEGVKKAVVEEGIQEGLLNIEKIRELQKDCIETAQLLRSENKDAAYRTAIKFEELNLKKQLMDPKSKGNKSIAGLMTLFGDNE